MPKEKDGAADALAKDINRQIGTKVNKAFLQRMPIFTVDYSMPEDLTALLGELDVAERRQQGRSSQRNEG